MDNITKMRFIPRLNRYTPFLMIIVTIVLYAHYHYRYQIPIEQYYENGQQTIEERMLQEKENYLQEFSLPGMSANDISLISPLHVMDTDNNIYFTNKLIPKADPNTFIHFNVAGLADRNILSKDKNHVYAENEIVKDADPDSFVYLGPKKIAFFDLNTKTTNAGKEYQDLYYAIDKNYVFANYKILEGADPNSFQLLDSYYDRDKDFIFYNGEKLEGSDAQSFVFYPLSHHTYTRHDSFLPGYAIDKNQAYYNFKVMNDVDIQSFEIVKGYYAKDKNHVYFQGFIVPEIDSETFEYINQPLLQHDSTRPIALKLEDYIAGNDHKDFYIYHDEYKRPNAYKHGYFRDKNNCFSYFNTDVIINKTWNCQLKNIVRENHQ